MIDNILSSFILASENIQLPNLSNLEYSLIIAVLISALIGVVYGYFLLRKVLKYSPGTEGMQEVAKAIQEGASAYLSRQFKTMLFFIVLIFFILLGMYWNVYKDNHILAFGVAVAFLMGVFASYGAGFVGMWLAVRANLRTANASLESFSKALQVAFQGGGVSGMFTIGLGLIGATLIFLIFKENAMKVLVGFGFGGSLAALFMRMGGGIYTKAADVGADLVGKVEKDIPEDDPRNAAVIADNVGDNVGDCAGMAADVFESYEVTLVAALILGAATLKDPQFISHYGKFANAFALKLIIFPLLVRAIGIFGSILGIAMVKGKEDMKDPMQPINVGFWASAIFSFIGVVIVNALYMKDPITGAIDWRFSLATGVGILLAGITLILTDFYTHVDRKPVTETAYSTDTGAATMLLTGLAYSMQSSVWAIVAIAITFGLSLFIFQGDLGLQMYAIALSGLGLLTTTGYVLAMDTYGPITDNANGIFEMSGVLKEESEKTKRAHKIVAKLDAIGNTTKALTKGLAIATAVIAATSLFSSFITDANLLPESFPYMVQSMSKLADLGIQIQFPKIFIGLLLGGAIPFLFSSFAINAVGRAAFLIVKEVRRQFLHIPGLMEGKAKPEYFKCVDISTEAAQKELIGPGILAIFSPIVVGFWLGAAPLGAFLAGLILSGQLLAVFESNAGAIWDNSKKKIEDGFMNWNKGSEQHKASVVGDTVGDPLKDTAGPAINPLIKVINLVSILIAPIVVSNISSTLRFVIVAISLLLLAISVWFSNRSNLMQEREKIEKE